MALDRNDHRGHESVSPEKQKGTSFAERSADYDKQIEQNIKLAVKALYQKCLNDESYMPNTEEVNTLLARMDSCDIEYPLRKRGENNRRTYFLRVYTSLLEQSVFEESPETIGSTQTATRESVSGLL